ncbi:Acyl-coenzyme A oxidase-like protein [Hondaea fermentalgiana]|uniref:Acyl-coenzyme A oxidase-like protein n=1 Tax=Hondaea fermentalgiana TaxID=2315210 RepID=A0A2R5GAM7_9STRA|nr:Acyl-coenzyme A oxidase-like protein [Hondaea fermentalgiana]|eukprot:GBG28060.1 Acyl-coenzyme A oxidase-like protein [Hondaea fermentalgiana]
MAEKLSHEQWVEALLEATKGFGGDIPPVQRAEQLRGLIKTGLLKFTDLRDNPERFFEAHRILLSPGINALGGEGMSVAFTVSFNLWAGSILGLGGPSQVAALDDMQKAGTLGCFCLTEKYAGVNSGLVVQTTATWIPERQQFLLDTPNDGAKKNWISQGLTATSAVVIANLIVNGKSHGPHGFVMKIRDNETGDLVQGVTMEDMGLKTCANDLDNAAVSFKDVYVDRSALLNRYADIQDDKYVQTTETKMRLEVIGQRLLTGRLAIAEASVEFARRIFERARKYADDKICWAPKGLPQPRLSEIPHIAAIFAEADAKLDALASYNAKVESRLCTLLRETAIPDADLVECIAVSKVKSVWTAIDLTDKLKRELGSYSLMAESGMQSIPWLLCCSFAEGDGRILLQKIARDSMKSFKKSTWKETGKEIIFGSSPEQQEMKLRFQLSRVLSSATSPADAARLWNENYELVYALADAVCDRHVAEAIGEDRILSKL